MRLVALRLLRPSSRHWALLLLCATNFSVTSKVCLTIRIKGAPGRDIFRWQCHTRLSKPQSTNQELLLQMRLHCRQCHRTLSPTTSSPTTLQTASRLQGTLPVPHYSGHHQVLVSMDTHRDPHLQSTTSVDLCHQRWKAVSRLDHCARHTWTACLVGSV